MTATVLTFPGRPPAAPAPTHEHIRSEEILRDGQVVVRHHACCPTCGAPLTTLEALDGGRA